MTRKPLVPLLVGVSLALCACAADEPVSERTTSSFTRDGAPVGEPEVEKDISYGDDDAQTLDLYRSPVDADSDHPLVIYVHGGGWYTGDKSAVLEGQSEQNQHLLLEDLIAAGFDVASVNYRLSGDATFPAPAEDVREAYDFLVKDARTRKIDADRVALVGDSAGAHLAMLLATEVPEIASVVSYYGPTDLRSLDADREDAGCEADERTATIDDDLLGGAPTTTERQELAEAASPVAQVNDESARMLLIQGEEDCTVAPAQATAMRDALEAADVPVELVLVEDAEHADPALFEDARLRAQVVSYLEESFGQR